METVATTLPSLGLSFRTFDAPAISLADLSAGSVVEFAQDVEIPPTLVRNPTTNGQFKGYVCGVLQSAVVSGESAVVRLSGQFEALCRSPDGVIAKGQDLYADIDGVLTTVRTSGFRYIAYAMEATTTATTGELLTVQFDGDEGWGVHYELKKPPPVVISGNSSLIDDLLLDRTDLFDPYGVGSERPPDGGSDDPNGPMPRPLPDVPDAGGNDCTTAVRWWCTGGITYGGGQPGLGVYGD